MVREPIKKTSIAKKNLIIQKGFELMCDRGYYNVSCVDIAKYAGVSTGIIYQYFNDKRDIFLEGIKIYSNSILFPTIDILNTKFDKNNLKEIVSLVLETVVKNHDMSLDAHEQIMAMIHLDKDVAKIFKENEIDMCDKLVCILSKNGFDSENLNVKIHIIMGLVDNYCHEVVYHKHESINYDDMKKEITNIIVNMLV